MQIPGGARGGWLWMKLIPALRANLGVIHSSVDGLIFAFDYVTNRLLSALN